MQTLMPGEDGVQISLLKGYSAEVPDMLACEGILRTVDVLCLLEGDVLGVDGKLAEQLLSADALYAPQHLAVDDPVVAEIEAQALRQHDGALLVHVVP